MIAIIDYGVGNVYSVLNAFEHLNLEAKMVSDANELVHYSGLVLPGVGSFATGMSNLHERGFVDVIRREINAGVPFLGFCLGLQLLAEYGHEQGGCEGLGLIKGEVRKLRSPDFGLPLPHIGWNDTKNIKDTDIFGASGILATYYFVHSYVLQVEQKGVVASVCDYGEEFVAAIDYENIVATQYHPEKSHSVGLKLLSKWAEKFC
jgi:glutamine amidotransferase